MEVGNGVKTIFLSILLPRGLFDLRRERYVWLFLAIFGVFTLMHMVTIVDWDQRYRLPLQPFLIALAGVSVAQSIRLLKVKLDLPKP